MSINLKIKLIFILCFGITIKSFCQDQVITVPIQMGVYMNCFPLINPASTGFNGRQEVYMGSQNHSGLWKNIAFNYLNINKQILRNSADENKTKHHAGFIFMNNKEGNFLRKTNGYLVYSIQKKIAEEVWLAAGTSLGVMNYIVKGSYANSDASSASLDGNAGVWLNFPKSYFGVSVNQYMNSNLQPFSEVTKVFRHYNITAGKKIELTPNFHLQSITNFRIIKGQKPNMDFTVSALTGNLIFGGGNLQYYKGIVSFLGLQNIELGNNNIGFTISYYFPYGKNYFNNMKTFELTVKMLTIGE